MKKQFLIVSVIAAIILIGILIYSFIKAKNSATDQNNQSAQTTVPENIVQTPAPEGQAGKYVEYDEQIIATTQGTKILFFHAPWCPQCRSLESSIESSDLPDGLTIIKIDYDSNQNLRQRYGVTLQTTFVKVDDSGNLIEKYVAYNEPVYASVKTNLID